MDNNLDKNMFKICRTCLQQVVNKGALSIDFIESNSAPTICHKLSSCVPDLDLSIVPNAVVCDDCFAAIDSAYKFKSRCLRTEMQIYKYLQQGRCGAAVVDLAQVVRLNDAEPGNLSDVDIKLEDLNEDFNALEEGLKCIKKEETELEPGQDHISKQEPVDTESELFNANNNHGSSSEQNNQNSCNSKDFCQNRVVQVDNKQHSNIHGFTKIGIFYECYTCGHKSKNKIKLLLHLRIHLSKKRYRVMSSKKPYFKNRLASFKSYKCRMCIRFTKYQSVLAAHVRKHLTKQQYKLASKCKSIQRPHFMDCIKIGRENQTDSYNKPDLSKSKKISTGKYRYKRNRTAKTKYLPNTHTEEKPYACIECAYRGISLFKLQRHLMIHTGYKPFKCTKCKYRTNQKAHLKTHMQVHTGIKPFKCTHCEFKTGIKGNLTRHMMFHTGDKPFKCTKCEFRTRQTGDLKRHMMIHTGDKPFKCTICKYETSKKVNLKTHMITHTGDRPFQCAICGFKFSRKENLKRHIINHTGDRPFKCTNCEFKTNWQGDLNTHMLIHTGDKPFKCTNCEFRTSRKDYLRRHIVKKHIPS